MEEKDLLLKVYDLCVEKDIDDAEEELKKVFKKVTYCDEKIDGWIEDDEEDEEYTLTLEDLPIGDIIEIATNINYA